MKRRQVTIEFREDAPHVAAFESRLAKRRDRIDTGGAVILGLLAIMLIIIRLAT